MMTSKHFWLANAALLVGATGAQAADLPFRKAAPVDYVRVCDAFGQGFFYIPGTDTCLRVTGQVRAEETFRANAPTNNPATNGYNQAGQVFRRDLTSFRARGYLNADSRTQTAYGALRAFVSIRLTNDTTAPGAFGGRGQVGAPGGGRFSTGLFQGFNPTGTQSILDKGFIQFAGLTAGRTQSFFDFDAQSYELLTNSLANSNQTSQVLAYTATFGGGFSATVSVEDANERRIGDNGSFVFSGVNGVTVANAPSYNNPITSTQRASILAYGGERIPDVVANVRYEAAWGTAQLSGAYHQLNSVPVNIYSVAPTGANNPLTRQVTPTSDGFAVLGGVKVLLPMLAKGDSLTIQGTYEEGAMDYVNPVNYYNGLTNVYHDNIAGNGAAPAAILGGQYGVPVNDAFINSNGTISKNRAVGVFAAIRHYFVPDVYGSLYGDYLSIVNPIQAQRLGAGTDSADIFQVGGNLIWTPVKDFQIGAEALYSNINYKSDVNGLYFGPAANKGALGVLSGSTPQNPDDYRARLSIRRAF